MTNSKRQNFILFFSKLCIFVGNFLTVFGVLGVVFGLVGFYDFDVVSYGLSSGVRMVGSVAIAGCLLSAIGYGMADFFIN
jgi:hypothetical protein